MRDLITEPVARYRDAAAGRRLYGSTGNRGNGIFRIPSPTDRVELLTLAADGAGWDHVSVSRRNRVPNWAEMEHIARLFFADAEAAMQLHLPAGEHVNMHPFTLHWWRPQGLAIPRPPAIMVGVGDREANSPADAAAMMREAGL